MRQFLFVLILIGFALASSQVVAQSTYDPDDVEVEILAPTHATTVSSGTAIALDIQITGDRPCPSTLQISIGCDGHAALVQNFSLPAGSTLPYSFQQSVTCPNAGANDEELEIKATLLDNGEILNEEDVDVKVN